LILNNFLWTGILPFSIVVSPDQLERLTHLDYSPKSYFSNQFLSKESNEFGGWLIATIPYGISLSISCVVLILSESLMLSNK